MCFHPPTFYESYKERIYIRTARCSTGEYIIFDTMVSELAGTQLPTSIGNGVDANGEVHGVGATPKLEWCIVITRRWKTVSVLQWFRFSSNTDEIHRTRGKRKHRTRGV